MSAVSASPTPPLSKTWSMYKQMWMMAACHGSRRGRNQKMDSSFPMDEWFFCPMDDWFSVPWMIDFLSNVWLILCPMDDWFCYRFDWWTLNATQTYLRLGRVPFPSLIYDIQPIRFYSYIFLRIIIINIIVHLINHSLSLSYVVILRLRDVSALRDVQKVHWLRKNHNLLFKMEEEGVSPSWPWTLTSGQRSWVIQVKGHD